MHHGYPMFKQSSPQTTIFQPCEENTPAVNKKNNNNHIKTIYSGSFHGFLPKKKETEQISEKNNQNTGNAHRKSWWGLGVRGDWAVDWRYLWKQHRVAWSPSLRAGPACLASPNEPPSGVWLCHPGRQGRLILDLATPLNIDRLPVNSFHSKPRWRGKGKVTASVLLVLWFFFFNSSFSFLWSVRVRWSTEFSASI